jgi:GNAT superfamily N-acetyltransferase
MLTDYDAAIEGGEAWVLDEAGELVGVLVARPGKNHLFVETVAVRPDRQGGGLGGRLMAFAEDEARRLGLREIRLYTNEKMRENFSFYGGLGFEETGRRTEDGYRRVFMRKRLEQEPEARTKGGNER